MNSAAPIPVGPANPVAAGVVTVGIDVTSVPQVRHAISQFGEHYLHRVFTDQELADCAGYANPALHLAARFAAKEAAIKALRVKGAQPPWTSIEVIGHQTGCSELHLTDAAGQLASELGIGRLSVSWSCQGDMAVAIVIAEARD